MLGAVEPVAVDGPESTAFIAFWSHGAETEPAAVPYASLTTNRLLNQDSESDTIRVGDEVHP